MTQYILAGNYPQFVFFCQDEGLNPVDREVVYVHDSQTLRGRFITPEDEVVRTGTYWDRNDAREIEATLSWRRKDT